MRLRTESVIKDIDAWLAKRSDEPWCYEDKLLLKCQLHIQGLARQIVALETALTQAEYRSKQWEERFNSGRLT